MKKIILSTICILILGFIFHSVYNLIPNFITSIFFPVNESIWEHGKMIILSFLVLTIIEKILLKNEASGINNNFLTAVICTILTYIIFSFVYFFILKTNDNLPITILIYTICIIISLIIREKKLNKNKIINLEYFGILGFIIVFIAYGLLTYNPIKTPIFYDYHKNCYGIPD